jgi:hypothetical protein
VGYNSTIARTAGTLVGGDGTAKDGYVSLSPSQGGAQGNTIGLPSERGSGRGGWVLDFETKFRVNTAPTGGNINVIAWGGLFNDEGVCIGSGGTQLIAYVMRT